MASHLRIILSCPDDRGLLAAVAGCLFDLHGDMGDAAFSLLGEEAQLSCVCSFADPVELGAVASALRSLPALAGGKVAVEPFTAGRMHAASGHATHVLKVRGADRPGLMARLAEGFGETGANVVRMDAERDAGGDYVMRFEVWVPDGKVEATLANAGNTAEMMGLTMESAAV